MSSLEKDDRVRILDGPFMGFIGVVDDIDENRNAVRVLVEVFGRFAPVELDVLQIEKMGN
jgi:transcriptional antiterminator NusG